MKFNSSKICFTFLVAAINTSLLLLPRNVIAGKMMERGMGMGMMGGKKGGGGGHSAMEAMLVAGILAKLLSTSNSQKSYSDGGQKHMIVPMPVIHMMGGPAMGGYGMGGYGMSGPSMGSHGGGYGMGMGGKYGMGMTMMGGW